MTDYIYAGTIFENDSGADFTCPVTNQILKKGCTYEFDGDNTWVIKNTTWDAIVGDNKPEAGATRNKFLGAFVAGTAYTVGDVVTSNGSSYSCTIAGTYNVAPPQVGWTIVAEKGAQGSQGATGPQGPAGQNGVNGVNGANGNNGDTTVRVYQLVATSASDPSAPASGTTYPPTNWSATPYTVAANQKQYQCDGIKNGVTGNIVWGAPYLSVFKVGTLEAFTAYVGSLKSGDDTKRLTINESGSHEFRAYANGNIVASLGDQATETDYAVLYLNLNYATSGASGVQIWQPYNKNTSILKSFGSSGNGEWGNIRLGNKTGTSWEGANFSWVDSVGNQKDAYFATSSYAGQFQGAGRWVQLVNSSYAIQTSGDVYVSGAITATGNITAYSDRKLKKNIKKLKRSIDSLNGYSFKWRKNFDRGELAKVADVGLIADEVEQVIPEAVFEDKNGFKTVDYTRIIPLLVEEIKALKVRVKGLENGSAK